MRTTGFGRINIEYKEDGMVLLHVFEPSTGSLTLPLSADELLLFLTEVCNGLQGARAIETKRLIEELLEKEKRR